MHFAVAPARVQRVEIGQPVDAKDHGLSVDNELFAPVCQGGLRYPREALGPIVAAAGDQPHVMAVPLDAKPVAVILDFVEPLGAGRHGFAGGRNTELIL